MRALLFNTASSLTSIIGGLAGYYALKGTLDVLPYAISVAAASLIYVAVADLIPGPAPAGRSGRQRHAGAADRRRRGDHCGRRGGAGLALNRARPAVEIGARRPQISANPVAKPQGQIPCAWTS